MSLKLEYVTESPGGLAKTQVAGLVGLTPRVSDLEHPGWGPRLYISNKFLGDADALGLIPPLRTTGLKSTGQTINFFSREKININIGCLIMAFLSNNFNYVERTLKE